MSDRIKRETRARMVRTGERFTTARAHVVQPRAAAPETEATPFSTAVIADLARSHLDDIPTERLVEEFNEYLECERNPWRLNIEDLTLELEDGSYEVPLDYCRTSAETLDWILQLASKSRADDSILAGLVRALELTIDPQSHLCTGGVEQGPVELLPEDVEETVRFAGVV